MIEAIPYGPEKDTSIGGAIMSATWVGSNGGAEPMRSAPLSGAASLFFRSLQLQLGLEALLVTEDGRNCNDASAAPIFDEAILCPDVADHIGAVPLLRVANVVNRHVVVL